MGSDYQKIDRKNAQIYIRDVEDADVSFIFNAWLKSFRAGAFCKYVDNTIYFAEHHKVVEKLLKRAHTKVACNPGKPEEIYGFLCYETIDGIFCAHYAYVKHTFRNLGIFRALLKAAEYQQDTASIFTHSTSPCAQMAPKFNMLYHPYILLNYLD